MSSEQAAMCENPQGLLDPPRRKRVRRDPGSVFEKNIVVLNSTDVLNENPEGAFLALNTMERAQLRRDRQRFRKMCFTQLMTEKEVQKKIEDPFDGIGMLCDKRYKFASADGCGNLNYHGKECWNGSEIKTWLPGTSALYILLQDNHQDGKNKDTKLKSLPRAVAPGKDSSPQGSMPSSPESPTVSPSLSSSCLISYPSSTAVSSSMTLMIKSDKNAAPLKTEYNDLGEPGEQGCTSFQTLKKSHSPQPGLSWSSSLSFPRSSPVSVGVSGTWFPPAPWAMPSCKCTPREQRSSQTSTCVSGDVQTAKAEASHRPASSETSAVAIPESHVVVQRENESSIPGKLACGADDAAEVVRTTGEATSGTSSCTTVLKEQDISRPPRNLNSVSDEVGASKDVSGGGSLEKPSVPVSTLERHDPLGGNQVKGEEIAQVADTIPGSEMSTKNVSANDETKKTTFLLPSDETIRSGLSFVQDTKEVSAKLSNSISRDTKTQFSTFDQRICGKRSVQIQAKDVVRVTSPGESENIPQMSTPALTGENVFADLINKATRAFRRTFTQSLMVSPLSRLQGGESFEEKTVQCFGSNQADEEADWFLSEDPLDIVEEIWPKEGPCTGGGAFLVLLKRDLDCVAAGKAVTVRFSPGGISCAYQHHQRRDRIHGSALPAAPHPGVSLVTVVTAEGRVLGETSFTYRDLRSEAQLEVERLLDEAFGWSGEERPRSPDDRAQHLSAIQEGIAARLEDVSDSVESAARRGDECFFQRMLANKSGRDSYKLCCQGEGRDPEDIARESGHPTLAAYLATNCPRKDKPICEKVPSDHVQNSSQDQGSAPLDILCEVASSRIPIVQSTGPNQSHGRKGINGDGNEADQETGVPPRPQAADDSLDAEQSGRVAGESEGNEATPSIGAVASKTLAELKAEYLRGYLPDKNFSKKAMILPADFATNPLTAMELAKLRKDRSEYGKVSFCKKMDERVVRETLKAMFCKLRDKSFSLAVMDHGRLSFHETESWNGRNVHKWCKNDKVLYIIPQTNGVLPDETSDLSTLADSHKCVPSDLSDKVEGSDENIDVSRAPNEEVDDSRGAHAARQLPVSS